MPQKIIIAFEMDELIKNMIFNNHILNNINYFNFNFYFFVEIL